MKATPASSWRSASRPESTSSSRPGRPDLAPRSHAILGLEVDQDVRVAEPLADLVLEHVRRAVRRLERRAGAKVKGQVEVAARAGAARAQLVPADDALAGAE